MTDQGQSETQQATRPVPEDTIENTDEGLGTLSNLNGLPELANPDTPTQSTNPDVAPNDLEAPSSALPESLGTTNTLDITAPADTQATLPGNANPGEVLPPSTPTAPDVGNTPSSGPIDVVPPAEIQPPTVPTIGGGSPDPIGEVAPPIGWESEKDVETFEGSGSSGRCTMSTLTAYKACRAGMSIQDWNDLTNEQQDTILGVLDSSEENLTYQAALFGDLVKRMSGAEGFIFEDDIEAIADGILITAEGDLGVAILGFQLISTLVAEGAWDAYQIKDFAWAIKFDLENGNLARVTATVQARLGVATHNYAGLIAGGTSNALNFTPFAGDLKGIGEAIWGKDLITGETLEGWGRWLGLAGIVGLAELRYLRYADDLARLGRTTAGTARYVDEGMMARAVDCALGAFRNSFSHDTPVATASGLVAIGLLKSQGVEEVYSYDEATGEVSLNTVTAFHEHEDPVIIELTIDPDLQDSDPGEIVTTTPEHPFYVLGEWVNGEDLEVGMPLSTYEGDTLVHGGTVTSVTREERTQTMYNLTVADAHTFFVGEGQWLVHNTGCGISFVDGSWVPSSELGQRLAGISDEIYRNLTQAQKGSTTVAVSWVDGQLVATVNGSAMNNQRVVNRVRQAIEARGGRFIPNNAANTHAETFLHAHLEGKVSSIGVSHVAGPCPSCQNWFNGSGVEISYTGEYK